MTQKFRKRCTSIEIGSVIAGALMLVSCMPNDKPTGSRVKNETLQSNGSNQEGTPAPSEEVGESGVDVLNATPQLLQKAVARVLGFADIQGRSVTIFQDAQSSLFDSAMKKKSEVAGSAGEPIFYHTPVFFPDKPKMQILDEGKTLKVTLNNLITPELVRRAIVSKLQGSALMKFNPEAARVGVIPMDSVSGVLQAFGKDEGYPVTFTKDFSSAIFILPVKELPQDVYVRSEEDEEGSGGTIDPAALLEHFDFIKIHYKYYVQSFKEESCQVNIDDNYINNMFQDSSCPNLVKTPTQAEIETIAANASATNEAFKNIAPILKQVQKPITRCLAGKETEKIMQRASVQCTTHAQDVNGNNATGLNQKLRDFLEKTIVPVVSNARLGPDPAKWDAQAAASAVALFGDPNRFVSQLNEFNTNVLNEKDTTKRNASIDALKDFIQKIVDTSSSSYSGNSTSSGKGSSFGIGIGGFGGFGGGAANFGSSSGNANSNESYHSAFNYEAGQTFEDRVKQIDNFFRERGSNQELDTATGTLKLIPHVDINTAADVNRIKQAASGFSNNELGTIRGEKEELTMDLKKRTELKLGGTITCDGNTSMFTKNALEVEWFNSTRFLADISKLASERVPPNGCRSLSVGLFYDGASANRDLIPDIATLNVIVKSKEGARQPQQARSIIDLKASSSFSKQAKSAIFTIPEGVSSSFNIIVLEIGG